jgi:hypothetical protein
MILASTSGDVLNYALAIFFVASGLALAYMLFRLGGTFARLSSFLRGTEQELIPVFTKAGGTVDRVNNQLDKLDVVTDSAVSMADSADTAVRAVSTAVTTPVKKISALSAAISHGASAFRSRKDVGEAKRVAKEAAARREAELDEELHAAGQKPSPPA